MTSILHITRWQHEATIDYIYTVAAELACADAYFSVQEELDSQLTGFVWCVEEGAEDELR